MMRREPTGNVESSDELWERRLAGVWPLEKVDRTFPSTAGNKPHQAGGQWALALEAPSSVLMAWQPQRGILKAVLLDLHETQLKPWVSLLTFNS